MNKQYNEYDSFDSNWASEIESINPSGQSQGNEHHFGKLLKIYLNERSFKQSLGI